MRELHSDRCLTCPLKSKGPFVLGEGEGEKLVIIGMAPGKDERRKGRPFVGRAGKVLRGVLQQLDFAPEDVRITNVVKCRPPDDRPPTRKELEHCLPHLVEELKSTPDASLLLLGNVAVRALTDAKGGITRIRGNWVETRSYDGLGPREALLTVHPSLVARPEGDRYFNRFIHDLQRALAGPVEFVESELILLDTSAKVALYFAALPKQAIVAWDLETSGYRFYKDYILAMSLSHEVGKGWVIPEELIRNDIIVHYLLQEAFANPDIRWIGHNVLFDQNFTLAHLGCYPKAYADTMWMHLALEEQTETHDLKFLARDYCGAIDWEAVIWSYLDNREDSYVKVPRDILYKYAACDADYTLRLFHIFEPMLEEDNVRDLHDKILIPASEAMMLAQHGGISVDMDVLDEWQCQLEDELEVDALAMSLAVKKLTRERIDELLEEQGISSEDFWKLQYPKLKMTWQKGKYEENRYRVNDIRAGVVCETLKADWEFLEPILAWREKLVKAEFSANSWQKVGTLAYEVLGLKYLHGRDLRARGKTYSTTNAVLSPYSDVPVINMILGYRSKRKLKSTYVDGVLPDEDYRVHPRWRLHATVTGRLGCIDPNMMNIPHESGVRDFFIASPEHVLIHADYSQAELRILAAYAAKSLPPEEAKETFLARVFREDRDLHDEAAITLFGKDWDKDGLGYENRMIAKAFNFGLVYGRSAKSVADAFEMDAKEAIALRDGFFSSMPEVVEYLEGLEDLVDTEGELSNVFGRKRRFPYVDDWNSNDLKRQARNFMMQSTASDLTLLCAVQIGEWFKEVEFGRILVFLHDSIMVEVPEAAMLLTARKMYDVMMTTPVEYIGDIVPMKVDISVGYGWASLYEYDTEKGVVL